MRRAILLCGATSFLLAFLGGALAVSIMNPLQATAQGGDMPEVRASGFVLVNSDGTVLARLAPGALGNGNLMLNDATGTQHLQVSGTGTIIAFGQDGAPVFRAGRTFEAAPTGLPPVNGVELAPDGSISIIPSLR